MLKKAIEAAGFKSRRAFIRVAEPDGNENTRQAYLALVLNGKRPPPLDLIDDWAAALKLEGADLERFIDLACVENMPERVKERFYKILTRNEVLEKRQR